MRDQNKENEPMELVPEETPAVKKKKVPAKGHFLTRPGPPAPDNGSPAARLYRSTA